jgi:hypothetical protein
LLVVGVGSAVFGCRLYMLLKFNVTAAVESRFKLGKEPSFNPQRATGISGRNSEEPHKEKKQDKDSGDLFWLQCRCNTTLRGRQSKAASHKYVM